MNSFLHSRWVVSYGRNSISHNVSAVDLLNIKTIAKRRNNMQWFKLPPKVYFEENSVMYLTEMDNVERVMIVCDQEWLILVILI